MDTTIKEQLEQMDLLQAFEMIVDKAKDSALGEKFYQEAEPYLNFVAEKLGISKRASVIMSLFADRCDDNHLPCEKKTEKLVERQKCLLASPKTFCRAGAHTQIGYKESLNWFAMNF